MAGLFLLARDWSLSGLGLSELALLACLAALCLWPLAQWYRQGMTRIPLGEAFVAMHLLYYVFPCLSGREDWLAFTESLRLQTLIGVGVFLGVFLLVYSMVLKSPESRLHEAEFLRREAGLGIMWGMFGLWIAWSVLAQGGLLPDLGRVLNAFRSIVNASGSMAVVYLFYQLGRKRLSEEGVFMLIAGFAVGLIMNFASGFLVGGAQFLAAAGLAYTLGSKRVPVAAFVLGAALLMVLHLGKGEFRTTYWGEGKNYGDQRIGLIKGYETWLSASWESLWKKDDETEKRSLIDRASLAQLLGTVMDATPAQKPFLRGETYLMLPYLLVPRVIWPGKPHGGLPTATLGIYYERQTEESVMVTSISFGQLAEAWANFGWFGLVGAGVFFGVLYGVPARLSNKLAPNQAGWLLASILLLYCIDLEHCIPEICSSLLQALLMGGVLIFLISREPLSLRQAFAKSGRLYRGRRKVVSPARNSEVA